METPESQRGQHTRWNKWTLTLLVQEQQHQARVYFRQRPKHRDPGLLGLQKITLSCGHGGQPAPDNRERVFPRKRAEQHCAVVWGGEDGLECIRKLRKFEVSDAEQRLMRAGGGQRQGIREFSGSRANEADFAVNTENDGTRAAMLQGQ